MWRASQISSPIDIDVSKYEYYDGAPLRNYLAKVLDVNGFKLSLLCLIIMIVCLSIEDLVSICF